MLCALSEAGEGEEDEFRVPHFLHLHVSRQRLRIDLGVGFVGHELDDRGAMATPTSVPAVNSCGRKDSPTSLTRKEEGVSRLINCTVAR